MVAIIDYRLGNIKSVLNATKKIGMQAIVTRDKEEIKKADAIILPGVGTFSVAMENLKNFELIEIIKQKKEEGTPILGICLGMQILFEKGFEVEETKGLGFLKGEVSKIEVAEKLPHMGWNELFFARSNYITKKIEEKKDVYFVHSYMANPVQEELIAYTEYGGKKIPAIVGKDNVIGCQFHPEKSSAIGLAILQAWKEEIERVSNSSN